MSNGSGFIFPDKIIANKSNGLPTSGKNISVAGMVLLLIAFGGFGAWAILAELSVSIVASGTVSVDSFKKTIQHLEGGVVSSLYVNDGDLVSEGDILIGLDKTQIQAQLEITHISWFVASAQEARLLAEIENQENLIFPNELNQAALSDVYFQGLLDVQYNIFVSRRNSLNGRVGGLEEQINQYQDQIIGVMETVEIYEHHIASLQDEIEDYRGLYNRGMVNNQRIRELERQLFQVQTNHAQARTQVAQLRSRISENRINIETYKQEYMREVGELLRDTQSIISETRESMVALNDRVRRADVIAPVSGTVVGLDIHNVGAVIEGGMTIMSIIPEGGDFFVEAKVLAQDIDNVLPGQSANIYFSSFNQREVSVAEGVVDHVSADSFIDEISGAMYYRIHVEVSDEGKEESTGYSRLVSGMPAEVMVVTSEKTLFDYLIQPVHEMLMKTMRES